MCEVEELCETDPRNRPPKHTTKQTRETDPWDKLPVPAASFWDTPIWTHHNGITFWDILKWQLASPNFRVGFAETSQNDSAFQLTGRLVITCNGSQFTILAVRNGDDHDEGYSYYSWGHSDSALKQEQLRINATISVLGFMNCSDLTGLNTEHIYLFQWHHMDTTRSLKLFQHRSSASHQNDWVLCRPFPFRFWFFIRHIPSLSHLAGRRWSRNRWSSLESALCAACALFITSWLHDLLTLVISCQLAVFLEITRASAQAQPKAERERMLKNQFHGGTAFVDVGQQSKLTSCSDMFCQGMRKKKTSRERSDQLRLPVFFLDNGKGMGRAECNLKRSWKETKVRHAFDSAWFFAFVCPWASPNLFVLCTLPFTQVCNKQLGRDNEFHNRKSFEDSKDQFELYRFAVELLGATEVCMSRGCKRMWPTRVCAPFSSPLVRCWQPQLREIPVPWCRILQVRSQVIYELLVRQVNMVAS